LTQLKQKPHVNISETQNTLLDITKNIKSDFLIELGSPQLQTL